MQYGPLDDDDDEDDEEEDQEEQDAAQMLRRPLGSEGDEEEEEEEEEDMSYSGSRLSMEHYIEDLYENTVSDILLFGFVGKVRIVVKVTAGSIRCCLGFRVSFYSRMFCPRD